jgi:hypothetical protein
MAPHKPDALAVVINGAFRNPGAAEAALLAKRLNVKPSFHVTTTSFSITASHRRCCTQT